MRAFDWTIAATNDKCVFGTTPISGLLYYDDAARQVHASALFNALGAPDQYFVIGA